MFVKTGAAVVTVDGLHQRQEWDVSGKQTGWSTECAAPVHATTLHCGAIAPDGKTIALGHGDGTVRLYDAATGKERRMLGRHLGTVWSVTYSPDGKTLASSARRHGVVRLWDIESGLMVRSFAGHAGGVSRVLFTPDGKRLIAAGGSFEPTIIVYEVATAKPLCRLAGHTNYVEAIAVAPDGKRLASFAYDQTVRLWDLDSAKQLRQWPGPIFGDYPGRVAFSLDGTGLFARDAAGELCLYDVATGRTRRRLAGIAGWIAASPDGRTFAVWGQGVALVEIATNAVRRRFPHVKEAIGGPVWATFAPTADGCWRTPATTGSCAWT